MRKFDYSFLKDSVSGRLLNIISVVYDIKGKESVRISQNATLFSSLKKKAIRDSILGSNLIENIHTTENRINDIAKGDNEAKTHDEKEIIGYRNVLNEVHSRFNEIILDKVSILSMHKQMLGMTSTTNRGVFKKEPNFICEIINGKKIPIFIPVSPKETEEAIDQLILAYQEAIHDSEINPLLLIPCVVLDFLCIHPFDDGNGRISRLLTLLLLYKAGFDIGRYISIENTINENKGEYYRTLQESSIGWQDNENNYEPFIIFMIQILYECYSKLDQNVFSSIDKKMSKSKRIEELLLNSFVPISKKTIMNQLPDISEELIEAVISSLLKQNKIIKIGSYKDASYYRK